MLHKSNRDLSICGFAIFRANRWLCWPCSPRPVGVLPVCLGPPGGDYHAVGVGLVLEIWCKSKRLGKENANPQNMARRKEGWEIAHVRLGDHKAFHETFIL